MRECGRDGVGGEAAAGQGRGGTAPAMTLPSRKWKADPA